MYHRDVVPRLPGLRFWHVGHTVQLDPKEAHAYYLHYGDKARGYAGVSMTWEMATWLIVVAGYDHYCQHYVTYLKTKSAKDATTFWVDDFKHRNKVLDLVLGDEHVADNKVFDDDSSLLTSAY